MRAGWWAGQVHGNASNFNTYVDGYANTPEVGMLCKQLQSQTIQP